MFAEFKSKEDIQKAIVEYLGEDEKDIRRIEFSKIYDKILISFFFDNGDIVAYHKVEYNNDIKMRVFHCGGFIVPEILFKYIQEEFECDPRIHNRRCSAKCKAELRKQTIRKTERVCKLCGKTFTSNSNTQQYCNNTHYTKCVILSIRLSKLF